MNEPLHTFVKIVHKPTGAVCSEWAIKDIAAEPFGVPSRRPMVYFADTHEALEKGIWCFENGMPRVFGEHNPAVSLAVAEKFAIDSLIADAISLETLAPLLAKRQPLESISLIGDSFDISLVRFAPLTKRFRLVLALPETGALAEAALSGEPRFAPVPGALLKIVDGWLVATKAQLLVTPLIRYDTGIRARGDADSFILG